MNEATTTLGSKIQVGVGVTNPRPGRGYTKKITGPGDSRRKLGSK